jgi:hypothetical protein
MKVFYDEADYLPEWSLELRDGAPSSEVRAWLDRCKQLIQVEMDQRQSRDDFMTEISNATRAKAGAGRSDRLLRSVLPTYL